MLFLEISLAALVAALLQLSLHAFTSLYAPQAGRLPRYVAGVLAIGLPFTALLAWWDAWLELAAFWTLTGVSGFVVIAAYRIGALVRRFQDGQDAIEREHAQAERKG
jgi:hypothetical protein